MDGWVVGAVFGLAVGFVAGGAVCFWLDLGRVSPEEMDAARDEAATLAKRFESLKEVNAETAAAVGRANDRHQAAEKRRVETMGLLEAERKAREQDGVTSKAREGQLIAERDSLRRTIEVRGAEAMLQYEIMAEWLRSHGYTVEG
jgi:hypothetical protein